MYVFLNTYYVLCAWIFATWIFNKEEIYKLLLDCVQKIMKTQTEEPNYRTFGGFRSKLAVSFFC